MTEGRRYRRRSIGLLAGTTVLAPSLLRAQSAHELTPNERALYEAAKSRREQVTWYISHYSGETAEAIGRAFDETFPGVKVNVVRTTAQVAYQRLTQDMRARVQNCDVFSVTDIGHFTALKADGKLEKYTPEAAAHLIEPLRGVDSDGSYHTTATGTVLINFNTTKLKLEDAPRTWTDLLDPKWRNRIAIGHPSYSGYVGTWAVQMRKLYGWDYFKKLEVNKPQIGRSINDTVTMLNSGERWVGAGPGATTLNSAQRGNPLNIIYPEDGTLLMISPTAIIKGARNPNAARLFFEFLLGKRTNQIHAAQFSDVVRSDVPPYHGAQDLSKVKVIRPTDQEIEDGIPEVKELWRDTFGV